jgi:hypothetical protein
MNLLVSSSDNIYLVTEQEIKPFVQEHPSQPKGLLDFLLTEPNLKVDIDRYGKANDYYGITWIGESIYTTFGEFPSQLVELDKKGYIKNIYLPPRQHPQLMRAHQITAAGTDIIITSTNNDLLFKFDTIKKYWSTYHLGSLGFKPILEKDILHPNSVRFVNNELHVVVLTGIIRFSYPNMQVIEKIPLDYLAHNSWEMDGEIWVCNSNKNCIESKTNKIQLEGWTRGVAMSDTELFVGAGQFGIREKRKQLHSKIFIIKGKEICFPGIILDIL